MGALDGHRALVTGAGRNLGAEVSARLAMGGAAVAVNYRTSQAEAESVVESLQAPRVGSHAAIGGDVSLASEASGIVARSSEALGGPIDILINNAGPYMATPFVELAEDDFDRVFRTNATATYLMARAAAPAMRELGWGRIVNLSASSAYVRNRSIYALANAAIITLTEELAVELAPAVTVNAVAPGQIHESLEELRSYVPEWAEEVLRQTPKGRLATRRDVADIIVALCTPLFDAVTGHTMPIDGGLRLKTF